MESVRNIYEKLHSIKGAGIKLQRDTKAFNYKYATLSQIQEKFGELIQEQGLVVIHSIQDGKVQTRIQDTESAEFVISEIEMTAGIKPQDKGSEITYYRRYNLLSLLDLEVEDDDGKKAQDSKVEKKESVVKYKSKFGDENYRNFLFKKDTYKTYEEAIGKIESVYDIDNHYKEQIKLLYTNF